MHFRLFHRTELNSPKTTGGNDDQLKYMKEITVRDLHRQNRISKMSSSRRRAAEVPVEGSSRYPESFEASIFSGANVGTGEYFVNLQMGTPARQYLLIADTGSDLTWTKCANDSTRSRRRRRRRHLLGTPVSSSFIPIHCSSDLCKDVLPYSLTECPAPRSPCKYDYRYVDGSFTRGFYGNETITVSDSFGNELKIPDVSVGCSSEFQGVTFGKADGVLGLGQSGASFAVTTAQMYSGKFSYCLVHHLSRSGRNYLVFGKNQRLNNGTGQVRSVPLVMDASIQPFYGLSVDGISFDGKMLPIPDSVWNFNLSNTGGINGGVIIDSGMTLTCLVKPAYDITIAAFREYFGDSITFRFDPFELCLNETELSPAKIGPQLVVHFNGGATFRPLIQSYVMEVAPGVRCVGLVSGAWPGVSIIGNILQERHIWEYDLLNGMLRFAPSSCRT